MKKINIQPDIDLQNSREYMGAYNSRDFYKGTSFKMAGEWMTNIHYFNDEYIIDFVAFEGALLSCTRSHTSSSLNMPELVWKEDKIIGIKPNLFWAFVMAGVEGPTGKVWVPEINNGILSWKESNTPPSSTSISDLKGPAGDTPIIGIKKDTSNNHYYWTVSINEKTEWIFDDSGQRVLAEGLTGATGAPGIPGEDGEDGITPQLKIEDGYWFVSYDKNDPPKSWIKLGQAKGDKGNTGATGAQGPQGPQGPKGDSGRTPALVRKFGDPDNLTDDRILWGYLGDPTSEWVTLCYLEELRGDSIKSVNISDAEGHLELTMESSKVITSTGSVLPRFNAGTIETVGWDQNPSLVIDKTNAPREWALNVKVPKGKPATVTVVSEVEKLAPDAQPYVTDLNPDISDANLKFGIPQGEKGDPGDENIAIGCQSDFPNNEPEHDKIWYDPCDESMDEYSVQDFLYNSYIAVGGTLTQEQFETAWKSFPNKSDIESLQTSVGGKQDKLTPGNAVSITEENVIDVKLDPASNEALSKSAEGLKLDLSGVKGSTVKVGVAITGGAEIGADQTVAEGMKALSDSIKTAVAGGITSITSPDNTIKVTGEGTSRGLAVDMSKLVSTSSSIQVGTDNKLVIFWSEIE